MAIVEGYGAAAPGVVASSNSPCNLAEFSTLNVNCLPNALPTAVSGVQKASAQGLLGYLPRTSGHFVAAQEEPWRLPTIHGSIEKCLPYRQSGWHIGGKDCFRCWFLGGSNV